MISAAERAADVGERGAREVTSEVHRDLSWEGNGRCPILRLQIGQRQAVEVTDGSLHLLDGDDLLLLAPEVGEDLLRQVDAHLTAGQSAKRDHPRQRAFQLADVRLDAARDEIGDVVRQTHALERGVLLEDGNAHREVRRLDVGDQPPLEARAQSLLDLGNVLRRAVARHDDLLARLVQIVERVEEFLLCPLFARDELDVIDEQEVDGAIAGAELGSAVVADGVDELVGEALRGQVHDGHAREEPEGLVPDGV